MNPEITRLEEENTKLKEQNAMKGDLISITAHQLRTNLSAMKWILKMFLDGDFGTLTSEQQNFMQKAFDSDERMIHLVNEMLSINHSEDTLDAYHPESVDIVKLIDEVYFDFTGESFKKGIELIFLKPAATLSNCMVDPEKMRVVFQNLIENAIKYSNKGGRVFITAGEKDTTIQISVRDTGIGISSEDKEKIFGKFYRTENAKKQDTIGSGLGLFTTKKIVESNHGKIWFESTEGGGTTFYVELPKITNAEYNPLMHKKILIVEDDSFLQGLASTKLEKEGFTVAAAASGDDALKILKTDVPDCILLDLILPGMDGFEVLRNIREAGATRTVPVIVFSNLSEDTDIKHAKDLGATDYMIKSNFTLDELADRIKELLK
jgi:CheY-like chemotaxis protein